MAILSIHSINPYPYGPIANLFPMGGGRHVSPSYDVF